MKKMISQEITGNRKTEYLENKINVELDAIPCNESLARVMIAAFVSALNPTIDEVEDIKTAVSEAVTNAIIHGYRGEKGKVYLCAELDGQGFLKVDIKDNGVGIEDIEQAMTPCFTTDTEGERSGMGFSFMEAFMDGVEVESEPMRGTIVHMWKQIGSTKNILSAAFWNTDGRI